MDFYKLIFRKKVIITFFLLLACLLIHFFSLNAEKVENIYSREIYPVTASGFRILFGWIPFSIGDFLWLALIVFIAIKIIQFIRFFLIKRRRVLTKDRLVKIGYSTTCFLCIFYILFNIFWGINYNRQGISKQLNLDLKEYSLNELKMINGLLVNKINQSKQSLIRNNISYPNTLEMFRMTQDAYETASKKFPFLQYKYSSIKKSIWGGVGNYTGFLGYYNPATGEAQVNTTVPKFTQSFTTCHEVAHQLGYAKEMEANFVGYLAAASSKDTVFQYSVYTDLFTYANRTLYFADSSSAFNYRRLLLSSVLDDYKERRKFNLDHTSFIEPFFRSAYGLFLISNQQPKGILSYDEVTAFIIAYYKKFGVI